MILTINVPEIKRTLWRDIKPGDVFSWGDRVAWYVKSTTGHHQRLAGSGIIPSSTLDGCTTLVVADRVEITP